MTDRRKALAVAAVLFVAFHSNCRAIGTRDTLVVELTALRLATSFDVNLAGFDEGRMPERSSGGLQRHAGRVLPSYPIVPALMSAPFFMAAVAAGVLDPVRPSPAVRGAVGKLAASLFTAAACGLLYLLIGQYVAAAPAGVVAIAAALASPYWSTASQSSWGHGPAAALLAAALLLIPRMGASGAAALAAGVAVALAVSTRALLFPFALGVLVLAWHSRSLPRVVSGMAIVFGVLSVWHLWTYGHLLGGAAWLESAAVHRDVHQVESAWSADLLTGAAGVLFSPNRGLLVYAPIAGFALVGGWRLWRTGAQARWAIVIPTLAYLACWSAYSVWWGGHSYGPRYAADLVIPLTLMVSAAFWLAPIAGVLKPVAAVALAWSIAVQAVGVYCYPNGDWNALPVDVDRAHARLWDWRDSQIARTAQAGLYTDHLVRLRSAVTRSGGAR